MAGLLALVLFAILAVLAYVLLQLSMDRNATARLLKERLAAVDQAALRASSPELDLLRHELLSEIPALNRLLVRSHVASRVRRLLDQADLSWKPGLFLLSSLALGVLSGLSLLSLSRTLLLPALFFVGGASLPLAYVSFLRARRFHRFEQRFPEAIDLLGRSIRAGHAFSTSLEMIGDEMEEPIAGEFRKLFEEQKFGLPLRDALLNLAERVPLIDVKFFTTAVLLQKETGGNLAELLDKLSYVIRERFKILRQVRVHTAQGRMTLIVLMSLPPLLAALLAMMNPEFIRPLFVDPMGHTLIAVGLTLQIIGCFLIHRIISIKV